MDLETIPQRLRPIIAGVLESKRTSEIAKATGLSPSTVTAYKHEIYQLLGISGVLELANWARSQTQKEKRTITMRDSLNRSSVTVVEADVLVRIDEDALLMRADEIRTKKRIARRAAVGRSVPPAEAEIPPKVLEKIAKTEAKQNKVPAVQAEIPAELLDDKPVTMENFVDDPNLPDYARAGMARSRALLEGQKIGEIK